MIVIRTCSGHDELEACIQLQVETWGYDPTDIIPRKAFLVGQKIGGQVIGAFDSDIPGASPQGGPESLVGFAMSLPGVKTGSGAPRPYLHSHMLAVKDSYRDRGLGAQLKLEQRREALSRNIHLMEWTFDPLEIKNAHLNIHKLGAIVRCYHVNFYGVSSSRLQGGLPTDRLVAGVAFELGPGYEHSSGTPSSRFQRRRTHPDPGFHLPMEGIRARPGASTCSAVREPPQVPVRIWAGISRSRVCPRRGRERSLRVGVPDPDGDGLRSKQ